MKLLLIALGSNLGDRLSFLKKGKQLLDASVGDFLAESPIFETEPFGVDHSNTYFNQVLAYQTLLLPEEILKISTAIELRCGRLSKRDLMPRSLDVDILSLGSEVFKTDELQLPHASLAKRIFVLIPLLEVCPAWSHPVFNKTPVQMISELSEHSWIKKIRF